MNIIKEVLEDKGIMHTLVAEKVGKSFSIINTYACNRRQLSLELLFAISKVLQVNVKGLTDSKG